MHLIFCFLIGISLSFAGEPSKVWGRIIKADHMNYKYFITYETNGELYAYPLEVKDKKLGETLLKNVDQLVNINGELKTITLQNDGRKQIVPVFVADGIQPLTLSQLSINNDKVEDPKLQMKSKEGYNGGRGGIQINDTAANTLIIGSAAVMVGSQLLKHFNKK